MIEIIFIHLMLLALVLVVSFGQENRERENLLDLIFANSGTPNQVCIALNTEKPFPASACRMIDNNFTRSNDVALGDLNGDGNLDAVFANSLPGNIGEKNRVCLGDGTGSFSCHDLSNDSFVSRSVALGDVNQDSHLDIVVAGGQSVNEEPNNQVCLGDGTGAFSCESIDLINFVSSDVALGDINGDGNLDAIFASMFGDLTQSLCLGDGIGGFNCQAFIPNSFRAAAVTLADLDSDGNLDIVFATVSDTNKICLGTNDTTFNCQNIGTESKSSSDVALGDIDGDGNLDSVFVNSLAYEICLGSGNGEFLCEEFDFGPVTSGKGVALGDLNGDGNLDAVFAIIGDNLVCFGNSTEKPFSDESCSKLATGVSISNRVAIGKIKY